MVVRSSKRFRPPTGTYNEDEPLAKLKRKPIVNLTEEDEILAIYRDSSDSEDEVDEFFKCGECFEGFMLRTEFIRHVQQVHINGKDFRCDQPQCGFECYDLEALTKHFTEEHEDRRSRLKPIERLVGAIELKHQPGFNKQNPYFRKGEDNRLPLWSKGFSRCGTCFLTVPDLALHKRMVHELEEQSDNSSPSPLGYYIERAGEEQSLFRCRICHVENKDEAVIEAHLKEVHFSDCDIGDLPACPWCNLVLNNLDSFADHVQEAGCYQKLMTIVELKRENNFLSKEAKKFIGEKGKHCHVCKKTMKDRRSAVHHVKSNHLSRINCSLCDISLGSLKACRSHKIIVHNVYPKLTHNKAPRQELSDKRKFDVEYIKFIAEDDNGEFCPRCKNCDRDFVNFKALQMHIERTHFRDRVNCNSCNMMFISKTALLNHQVKVHSAIAPDLEKTKYEAKYPPEVQAYLDDPINSFAEIQRSWMCKDCNKNFQSVLRFVEHVKAHLGIKDIVCEHCGRAFSSAKIHRLHLKEFHNDKLAELEGVETDDKTIEELSKLSSDEVLEQFCRKLDTGQYQCKNCLKFLSRGETAVRHVRKLHWNIKNIQCDKCEFMGYDAEDMKNHEERKHSENRKKVLKRLPVDEAMAECMFKEDEGEPLTSCKRCKENGRTDADFGSLEALKNHIGQYHLLIRELQCDQCSKRYQTQKGLRNHVKKEHSRDVKELQDEAFVNENVERAKELFGNVIKCPLCPDSIEFKVMPTLKNHLKTVHLKIKRWVCKTCNKGMTTRTALAYHMEAAHGELLLGYSVKKICQEKDRQKWIRDKDKLKAARRLTWIRDREKILASRKAKREQKKLAKSLAANAI